MKIMIALASAARQLSGVQRHAINLALSLLTRGEISQVHLVVSPWQRQLVQDHMPQDSRVHLHVASIGQSVVSRNLWFYLDLPKLAAKVDADVVHLAYPMPIHRAAFDCSLVVTLHDLYPYDIPENFGFRKVLFNRMILRQCLRSVDAITCVSKTTYARLKTLNFQAAFGKAVVLYNSIQESRSSISITADWAAAPFLLLVAQHRRNKNILLALRAFRSLFEANRLPAETRMVIVGIAGPETSAIQRFITESGLIDQVVLLSGISDAELDWCYTHCRLLFAPSSVEGFGLPVAEALLAGCRVVCSDIPAFRELGGHDCLYVPLGHDSEEAFATAICDSLRMSAKRPVAFPQLSRAVISRQYIDLYRSLSRASSGSASPLIHRFDSAKERQLQ